MGQKPRSKKEKKNEKGEKVEKEEKVEKKKKGEKKKEIERGKKKKKKKKERRGEKKEKEAEKAKKKEEIEKEIKKEKMARKARNHLSVDEGKDKSHPSTSKSEPKSSQSKPQPDHKEPGQDKTYQSYNAQSLTEIAELSAKLEKGASRDTRIWPTIYYQHRGTQVPLERYVEDNHFGVSSELVPNKQKRTAAQAYLTPTHKPEKRRSFKGMPEKHICSRDCFKQHKSPKPRSGSGKKLQRSLLMRLIRLLSKGNISKKSKRRTRYPTTKSNPLHPKAESSNSSDFSTPPCPTYENPSVSSNSHPSKDIRCFGNIGPHTRHCQTGKWDYRYYDRELSPDLHSQCRRCTSGPGQTDTSTPSKPLTAIVGLPVTNGA